MPIRSIRQLGDPVLRQKSVAVADAAAREIRGLVQDLADTLAHWRSTTGYGRAIAAPQLGVLERVIFLKLPGSEPWPLINPEIVQRSQEKIVVWDACLSFLSIFMQVERHRFITVRYQNLGGETLQVEADDDRNLSELLQHEIDHLDGILAIDRVVDIKTICTREEFEKRYRDASPYATVRSDMSTQATAELRHTIAEPWLSLAPVRVGDVPSGIGTPTRYVTVQAGQKLLRIDVYPDREACHSFEEARVWRKAVVVGFGHSVFFVSLEDRSVKRIDLGGYFGSFHVDGDILLVASEALLFRLSSDGDVTWRSEELGIDGVMVDRIEDDCIHGQGEWDPPGGWRPFVVSLDSGERIGPART